MNKTLSFWLKIIAMAGFIVCAVWAYNHPYYDSVAAVLGCLGGLLTLFVAERKSKPKPPTMHQRGGKDSTNYQAGGDMIINSKP